MSGETTRVTDPGTTRDANEVSSDAPPVRVAVAIPCYNEAPAIPAVLAEYRAALPDAEIVVFDNNSTDGTRDLARALGARVECVTEQGKGFAVRAAFELLRDCDVLVLTDGDGTYPASEAHALIAAVASGADMAVGARRPVEGTRAMSLVRGTGNLLIKTAFRVIIGPGNNDLLSGYRDFGRRYRAQVRLRSEGFEIETELAAEAVARGLKVVELPVPYHPRIAGTVSKLSALRDGKRILLAILRHGLALRPRRLLALALLILACLMPPWNWLNGIVVLMAVLLLSSALVAEEHVRRAQR